jgi:cytoskeletal protein CcmA (bactofilin family)
MQAQPHPTNAPLGPLSSLAPRAPAAPTGAPITREAPPKLLIVGPEINLAGEITACDRLVVEGSVQVTLNRTRAIEITETGRFTNGKAEVDEAEIGGVYEGALTVRGRLLIRATGRVSGAVRYGELEIERGGRLSGAVERLASEEPARAAGPPTVSGFIPASPAVVTTDTPDAKPIMRSA